jgi:hypothetical protein
MGDLRQQCCMLQVQKSLNGNYANSVHTNPCTSSSALGLPSVTQLICCTHLDQILQRKLLVLALRHFRGVRRFGLLISTTSFSLVTSLSTFSFYHHGKNGKWNRQSMNTHDRLDNSELLT